MLKGEFGKDYFQRLQNFLAFERSAHTVFPAPNAVFHAFTATPFEQMRVLLVGQDPYHDDGQAHGLSFSVQRGVPAPPSLRNIFRELHDDLGCPIPQHGCLEAWARQGVLLLNAVLTVRAHEPNSHRGQGWEQFTDAVVAAANARPEPVVFVLWGASAQKKGQLIDRARHPVIESAHPSPLSARKFFGTRPFSKINAALRSLGQNEINWTINN